MLVWHFGGSCQIQTGLCWLCLTLSWLSQDCDTCHFVGLLLVIMGNKHACVLAYGCVCIQVIMFMCKRVHVCIFGWVYVDICVRERFYIFLCTHWTYMSHIMPHVLFLY